MNHFMLHKKYWLLAIFVLFSFSLSAADYLVLTSKQVVEDVAWKKVVDHLVEKHHSTYLIYDQAPDELMDKIREHAPRYICIVEKPENLDKDYIISWNIASRKIDPDMYLDCFWGIVTGKDASAAMKMLENSTEPFVVKTGIASVTELSLAKWFDKFGWVDDHREGIVGEKRAKMLPVTYRKVSPEQVLPEFVNLYNTYEPDFMVTASHATEKNLEMPYSDGNIIPVDGDFYAVPMIKGKKIRMKKDSLSFYITPNRDKPFLCMPIGNCLIGNVNNDKYSMASTWISNYHATTFIGYVVPTWYGRNGWGVLKYFLTTPGKLTAAESFFLNMQDMLYRMNKFSPEFMEAPFNHQAKSIFKQGQEDARVLLGRDITTDELGFWHDRDVVAYYGDPKWNVRLQEIPEENDYTVSTRKEGNEYILTIETKENFSLSKLTGDKFKNEHVADLPFCFIFPERLKNPTLAKRLPWETVVTKDAILIYEPTFKPNLTYEIRLSVEP